MSALPLSGTTEDFGQPEIARITPRHQAVINLALAGFKVKDIAQATNQTPQNVSLILKSAQVQEELARRGQILQQKVDDKLVSNLTTAKQQLVDQALDSATKLGSLQSCGNPQVELAAAKANLDFVLGGEKRDQGTVIRIDTVNIALLTTALKVSRRIAVGPGQASNTTVLDDPSGEASL